jgi:CubicO group peptidase (beta-lactamase class C family)
MGTVMRATRTLKDGSMERKYPTKQVVLYLVICTSILALLLTGCASMGRPRLLVEPEAATEIDEMLTAMAGAGTFTGSVLIAQDGKVLLSQGYGLADRAQGVPNTRQTRFHLGSNSKNAKKV